MCIDCILGVRGMGLSEIVFDGGSLARAKLDLRGTGNRG